ncbi:MAG: site-2 protease family protein, partial [Erysipelotrichaceae bacterium]|nr:site-2 protease family protein [Erysipelotrichaceae bacterium]
LSVNVGIFNLLPIPILDGGRIFIVLIETLIGRKLNERIQSAIMMAGLLMIVGIMVLATWNDISRLF